MTDLTITRVTARFDRPMTDDEGVAFSAAMTESGFEYEDGWEFLFGSGWKITGVTAKSTEYVDQVQSLLEHV